MSLLSRTKHLSHRGEKMNQVPTSILNLHVKASCKQIDWNATVCNADDPSDYVIIKPQLMMVQLVEEITVRARERWKNRKLNVSECVVEDDEDAGCLKQFLQDVFNK
jgi:hypothetical protein